LENGKITGNIVTQTRKKKVYQHGKKKKKMGVDKSSPLGAQMFKMELHKGLLEKKRKKGPI